MTDSQLLDNTIRKAAFWSAIVLILAGVLSIFFPLDAPAGPYADRMQWYSSNLGAFVSGWVIQMIAMLTLSGVFAGTAWQVRKSHPLSAFIAGTAVLVATIAFIIPKFIAIWSIPQIVVASSTVSADVATADIGLYAESMGLLLLIPVISMAIYFRKAMTAKGDE